MVLYPQIDWFRNDRGCGEAAYCEAPAYGEKDAVNKVI